MEERREVGWKEYTESRLVAIEREMGLRAINAKEALDLAREPFELRVKHLERHVGELNEWKSNIQGRLWAIGALVIVIPVLLKLLLK